VIPTPAPPHPARTRLARAIAQALAAHGVVVERPVWDAVQGRIWRPVEYDSLFRALSITTGWRVRLGP
jgi:hypothetical protein